MLKTLGVGLRASLALVDLRARDFWPHAGGWLMNVDVNGSAVPESERALHGWLCLHGAPMLAILQRK